MITLIIWQFYNETAISSKWSIRQRDFLFYFLFSVAIIPFQVIIDILFYNIMSFYLEFDMLNSLKRWKRDYSVRGKGHFWRGYQRLKTNIDMKLRPIEQMSFSSQFYFLAYLGVAGHLIVIIGIMIILETKDNAYTDPLFAPLLLMNQLLIFAVEWLSLWLRRRFRVWEQPKQKPAEDTKIEPLKEDSSAFASPFDKYKE